MEIGWRKRRRQRERGYKPVKKLALSMNLDKYDGVYTCECCSRAPLRCNQSGETRMHPEIATVDHILDLGKGGTNDISNLQVLCYKCNNDKSNKKND